MVILPLHGVSLRCTRNRIRLQTNNITWYVMKLKRFFFPSNDFSHRTWHAKVLLLRDVLHWAHPCSVAVKFCPNLFHKYVYQPRSGTVWMRDSIILDSETLDFQVMPQSISLDSKYLRRMTHKHDARLNTAPGKYIRFPEIENTHATDYRALFHGTSFISTVLCHSELNETTYRSKQSWRSFTAAYA